MSKKGFTRPIGHPSYAKSSTAPQARSVKPANDPMGDYDRINGCEVADDCLQCPLPSCRFDDQRRFNRRIRQMTATMMQEDREAERLSVAEISERYHYGHRATLRLLKVVPDPMSEAESKVFRRLVQERLDQERASEAHAA